MADLDTLAVLYRDSTLTKRELERHLRAGGLSQREAKIVVSKCGRDLKPKGFLARLKETFV